MIELAQAIDENKNTKLQKNYVGLIVGLVAIIVIAVGITSVIIVGGSK